MGSEEGHSESAAKVLTANVLWCCQCPVVPPGSRGWKPILFHKGRIEVSRAQLIRPMGFLIDPGVVSGDWVLKKTGRTQSRDGRCWRPVSNSQKGSPACGRVRLCMDQGPSPANVRTGSRSLGSQECLPFSS